MQENKNGFPRYAGTNQNMLHDLLKETFAYFVRHADPNTGLIADKTREGSPASIGVVGMGLSALIVGIENKLIFRDDAIKRILTVLRFAFQSHQGPEDDAAGYKGFFYHFLDMENGKRVWNCEISTIDSAFFIAGALSVAGYFAGDHPEEQEIRQLAADLYARVDWQWAMNGGDSITNGWTPENGFIPYRWDKGYSEAMILYMLALGSPTYPIKNAVYKKWIASFEIKRVYGIEYIYAGPLFIHQFSHLWLDFRNIRDDRNRQQGYDYFENSRRATYVHRKYAQQNPQRFEQYNEHFWGLSASDGPGNQVLIIKGKATTFYGYLSRGAPDGPDDGTVSPWSVVASLPFAPEIVLETIRYFIERFDFKHQKLYGFESSFNPTYPEKNHSDGWVSPYRFGLNQGAIVIMIENHRTGLIWNLIKKNKDIQRGMDMAGFTSSNQKN